MSYKCINREKKGNKIIAYELQDENSNKVIKVTSEQLKEKMKLFPSNFSNLTLTKNGRILFNVNSNNDSLIRLKRLYKDYPSVIKFCMKHKNYIQSMLDWETEGVACNITKEDWIRDTLPNETDLKQMQNSDFKDVLRKFVQNRKNKTKAVYKIGVDWGITSKLYIPEDYRCYYIDTTEEDELSLVMSLQSYLFRYSYSEEALSLFVDTPRRLVNSGGFKLRAYVNAVHVEDEQYRIFKEEYHGSRKYFRDYLALRGRDL